MPSDDILPYVGRLTWNDQIVGTGFVVHKTGLIATCYHVLAAGGTPPSRMAFTFEFLSDNRVVRAIGTDRFDLDQDVALLQAIESFPSEIEVARLVRGGSATYGLSFQVQGFGLMDDPRHTYEYSSAIGTVVGPARRDGVDLLQLDSKQILRGMSGGPVVVASLGGVIGIVSARYSVRPGETWMRDGVWAARIERLVALAADLLQMAEPSMPFSYTFPDASAPSTPANSELSSTPVVSSTFFTPQEHLRDVANKCVGREQELDKLHLDFASTSRRLILIEGFGGLGKTTLASRFAIDSSQYYNILWVDCSGIPPSGERFLREMGNFASNHCKYPFLSITVEDLKLSLEEKEKALLEFLSWVGTSGNDTSSQPVAFFFDDYHLVEDPTLKRLVVNIAESHMNVKAVLIIRYLPTELQLIVDPANSIQLEGLSTEECRKLIEMYATSYPALRNLDDEKLQHIWKLTGQGIPTALRIFISMTRKLTVDDVLDELPSLTAVTRENWFDKLFRELSLDEQQVASEVSIFRRPTLRRALINVSQCAKVKEVIEALVDRFVLTFDGKQYSMHALWLYYIRQHLSSADAKVLHQKAADFYHSFESSDRHAVIMSRLESCYHYIQAEEMEQAEKELISIASTLRSWGFFKEFTDILIEIEKDAKTKNRPLAPQLVLEKSSVMYAHGDVEQAITSFSELASKGSDEIKIKALLELGWIYTETANRREAERMLKQSRELAHQSNRADLEEQALYLLQEIAYIQSEYKKALDYDQQRLRILKHMQNDSKAKEAIAYTYHQIGNIYRERGYYDEALEYYQRYLPFWHELGNPYNRVGWLTYNIGEVYRDQGKLQEALDQFENALQLFNKMQYIYGIAHVKIELGRVGVKLGPPDKAIEHVQEAIDILHRIKGKSGEAYGLAALGEMYLYLGKLDLALQYLQDSILLETSLGNIKERARSLHLISLLHEKQGKSSILSGNYTPEACAQFHKAAETIAQAQELFSQIDAAPNIYGIQDLAVRIQRRLVECIDSTLK